MTTHGVARGPLLHAELLLVREQATIRSRGRGGLVNVQRDQPQVRVCAHCEFEDSHLHAVRLQRRTGEVVESLVCRFCYMQLTGIAPGTARAGTRQER